MLRKQIYELRIPKHRLTLRVNGVYYASIKFFKKLPTENREERSYSRYSLRLEELLLYNSVYNNNEFDALCKYLRQNTDFILNLFLQCIHIQPEFVFILFVY